MHKISIIIPAYNAAMTIEKTVRSVLASTIPVDVWVVDDGSTDSTAEILDRLNSSTLQHSNSSTLPSFAKATEGKQPFNHSTLHLLRQENQGAYRARLNALKQITTPWFGFVDADDTVEPDMFEKMLSVAERDGCDVVQCGKTGASSLETSDVKEYVRQALIEGTGGGAYIWDKIYRNQYDFNSFDPTDNVTNFDDLIFNLYFFEKVKKMGVVDEPLYHYATTEGSAVHGFSARKLKDFRETCRMRRLLLPRYGFDPDGEENRKWFRMNRMNCVKSALRAGNLGVWEKMRLIGKLLKG